MTLDFDVPGAPALFSQWRYVGNMRDGRMPIDHGIGIREPGGRLELNDGRLTGAFRRIHGRRDVVEMRVAVDAEVRDGRIEGRAFVGDHAGTVSGRMVSEAELRRRNAIAADKGWPTFLGPAAGGTAAEPTGVELIESPDQIELMWRAEEGGIGQGIGSISRFMHGWRDANGLRTCSGSSSAVLADGRVYL